jgi:hypothetical protein
MSATPEKRSESDGAMAPTRPPFVQQIRDDHPDKTVEIWYQDEARIGQQGTLTTVWAETGTRQHVTEIFPLTPGNLPLLARLISQDCLVLSQQRQILEIFLEGLTIERNHTSSEWRQFEAALDHLIDHCTVPSDLQTRARIERTRLQMKSGCLPLTVKSFKGSTTATCPQIPKDGY